jgi:hypothetical protein
MDKQRCTLQYLMKLPTQLLMLKYHIHTDIDGRAPFLNVPADSSVMMYRVQKEGFQTKNGNSRIYREPEKNVIELTLKKSTILIYGEVSDVNNMDINGADIEVKLANITKNTITNHSGNYAVEIDLNNKYASDNILIKVKKGACTTKDVLVIPRNGDNINKNFRLDCFPPFPPSEYHYYSVKYLGVRYQNAPVGTRSTVFFQRTIWGISLASTLFFGARQLTYALKSTKYANSGNVVLNQQYYQKAESNLLPLLISGGIYLGTEISICSIQKKKRNKKQ